VSSSIWEQIVVKALHGDGVRFPRGDYLRGLYEDARRIAGVPVNGTQLAQDRVYHKWLNTIIARGYLARVQRDLYANYSDLTRPPQITEVAELLRPTAIVSLQSVLGKEVGNNQSRIVTAVISSESEDAGRPRVVKPKSNLRGQDPKWEFRFYSMPAHLYEAGAQEDRLDANYSYPRATMERALCDMLLLRADHRSSLASEAAFEADITGLDMNRMERLVAALGIDDLWSDYMEKVSSRSDEDFDPSSLGYNF